MNVSLFCPGVVLLCLHFLPHLLLSSWAPREVTGELQPFEPHSRYVWPLEGIIPASVVSYAIYILRLIILSMNLTNLFVSYPLWFNNPEAMLQSISEVLICSALTMVGYRLPLWFSQSRGCTVNLILFLLIHVCCYPLWSIDPEIVWAFKTPFL